LPPAEAVQLEREYLAHREDVVAMLRAEFPRLGDHEELYHDAWAELLEMRARGDRVTKPSGLLRTIAWRRARDRARKKRPDSIDPTSPVLTMARDPGELPDVEAQVRLDAAAIRQIVEQLEPRQATVLKLRFDWGLDAREIQQRLGITPKRLEKIVTEAYKTVAAELHVSDGETAWARKQRSLLLACEIGLATAEQRARAQRMVDEDPACRAMLREMRSALRDVAVAVPTPVLFEQRGPGFGAVLDRAEDVWASAKQAVANSLGRGAGQSSTIEQAGSAGAIGLGGGAAAKIAAACLAAGGTAAVCVESGLLGGAPKPAETQAERPAREPERTAVKPERAITFSAVPTQRERPKRRGPKRRSDTSEPTTPVSSPQAEPPPSPAPEGSTEFGPGALGSSSAPAAPAAAPQDGGGEFGP
jgi:RNA polymerase sigma factor (sigma-70 family)